LKLTSSFEVIEVIHGCRVTEAVIRLARGRTGDFERTSHCCSPFLSFESGILKKKEYKFFLEFYWCLRVSEGQIKWKGKRLMSLS